MDIIATQERAGHPTQTATTTLKRRASSSFDDLSDSSSRKRPKADMEDSSKVEQPTGDRGEEIIDGQVLADELEQELQCGCCSALVYRPVIVSPCQHFFCGSCVILWVKNGGTNYPACRGASTVVTPSRALQTMTDILVRAAPSKARSVNERIQADDIYKVGTSLRIPTPRQPSPEPSITPTNPNYAHPCPHCIPGNQWGWECTRPIVDPEVDPDNAWHTDNGPPPAHGYCGNCECVLALHAPTTSKCDFCQVSFCGINIPGRCVAASLLVQHLHGLSDLSDLIQCGAIYEIFDSNAMEVEILFDYLSARNITPRHIYHEVLSMIIASPRQFAPLLEAELFVDMYNVVPGEDVDHSASRNRICRLCATEVMLWGLRAWWLQERKKGLLEESVLKRPDCPEGRMCELQRDYTHCREFNHITAPVESAMPSAEENAYPTEEAGLERAQAAEPERAQIPESRSEPHDGPRTERHNLQSPNEGNAATIIDHIDNNMKDIASPLPQVSTGAIVSLASDGDVSPSFPQSQDARDEVDAML